MTQSPPREFAPGEGRVGTTASLAPFVSRHHLELLAGSRGWRTAEGTLLFADVAGFTALNERLAGRGREGAELMVNLLDAAFGRALDCAAGFGGDLLKFGGDALLILFDGPDHCVRAAAAAWAMQHTIRTRTDAHRAIGRVQLSMSMGLESGAVTLLRCGEATPELVVIGPTLEQTLRCETEATGGEILLGPNATRTLSELEDADGATSVVEQLAVAGPSLRRLAGSPVVSVRAAEPPAATDDEVAARGLTRPVRDHLRDPDHFAEHRPVTTVFVKFLADPDESPRRAAARIGRIVDAAQRRCDEHEVTFLTADVGVGSGKLVLLAGAPRSFGESTERALDVALDLVVDLGDQVSVGINEGVIFCGEVGNANRRAYATIGDAVNLAARVMARAAPGEVLCERSTFASARGGYGSSAIEPFMAKGKARPVEAVTVSRDARVQRTDEAPLTLAGRDVELSLLAAAAVAVEHGGSQVVQIVAPAGMGKSTLIDAAVAATTNLRTVSITGGRYLRLSPFAVTAAALRELLGLLEEPATPGAARELAERIDTLTPDLTAWAPLIGVALGISLPNTAEVDALEPQYRAHRLHQSVLALAAAASGGPLALIVDDAQWLDEATTELLDHVARERPPGLLLVTGRRPGVEGLLLPGDRVDVDIELGPLDESTSTQLVRQRSPAIDPHVTATVVERAAGHPLFLLALVNAVQAGQSEDLPTTVEDALRAELDRLDSKVRWPVGHAAVLGMRSDLELLARCAQDTERSVRRHLDAAAGFVEVHDAEYQFTHPLRRDAAYQALPLRQRREAHARAATALLEWSEEPPPQLMSLHLHESSQYDSTWTWARLAARRALQSFAPATAVVELQRALAAARKSSQVSAEHEAEVWEELGEALEVLGRFSEAEAAYRRACRIDPSPDATARRRTKVGRICAYTGDIRRGLVWVARAQDVATELSPATRAFVMRERASLLFRRGDLREALVCNESAATLAREGRDEPQLAEALRMIGTIRDLTGSSGVAALRRALQLYERQGNPRGAASALNNLAAGEYDRGEWEQAIEHYQRCADRAGTVGDLILAAIALNNLAEIHSDRGHLDLARPIFNEALHTWTSLDYRIGRAVALNNLGRVARRAGDLDGAAIHLDEAMAIFREIDAADFVAEVWLRSAEVALAAGDPEECGSRLDNAVGSASAEDLGAPLLAAVHRLRAIAALRIGDRAGSSLELAAARRFIASAKSYEAALVLEVEIAGTHRPSARSVERLAGAFARLGINSSGQQQLLGR